MVLGSERRLALVWVLESAQVLALVLVLGLVLGLEPALAQA